MKAYIGMFREEAKRLFTIKYLLLTLFAIGLIIALAVFTYCQQYGTEFISFYSLQHTLLIGGCFFELIFIALSFFVTTNLCSDINHRGMFLFITRSSSSAYIAGKMIVGIIFSFVVIELALNFCYVVGTRIIDVFNDYDATVFKYDSYGNLLSSNSILFIELKIALLSLSSAFYTGIALLITSVIPNKYVAAMAPYLSYILLDKLGLILKLPRAVRVSSITNGYVRVSESLSQSVLYMILFFCSIIVVVFIAFYKVMKWRCYNEK